MNLPLLSIIVCTHNRAESLRAALGSLYDLETCGRFDYEIVVIDNASVDATPDVIAEACQACRHPVRGVYEGRKGIPAARNRGIAEAKGDWIAFFDDDQLAQRDWLSELFHLAESKEAAAVGGRVLLQLPEGCQRELSNACRMLLGESDWSHEPMPYDDHRTPGAGNFMLRREVFQKIGLFDEAVGNRGEDTDLYRRMQRKGLTAWYAPQAIILHIIPQSRLEESYLQSLGRRMGEGVARYECGIRKRHDLLFRLFAKRVRATLCFRACEILAQWSGRSEAALGYRCLMAISAGYHNELKGLLFPPRAMPSLAGSVTMRRSP